MSILGVIHMNKTFDLKPFSVYLLWVHLLIFFSCSTVKSTKVSEQHQVSIIDDYRTMSTLWVQHSPEFVASTVQAYNYARDILKNNLLIKTMSSEQKKSPKKFAVIMDIDETVLDNSALQAKLILDKVSFQETQNEWFNLASAPAIPGAVEFTDFAQKNKVDIFYVTNRKDKYCPVTLKNLINIGIKTSQQFVICKKDISSKRPRWESIEKDLGYKILLQIGDSMTDFSDQYETGGSKDHKELLAREHLQDFGTKFIIIPNAMYGNWEWEFYRTNEKENKKSTETDLDKIILRQRALKK